MNKFVPRLLGGLLYVVILVGSLLWGRLAFGIVLAIIILLGSRELRILVSPATKPWKADLLGVSAMLLYAALSLIWMKAEMVDIPVILAASGLGYIAYFLSSAGKGKAGPPLLLGLLVTVYLTLPLLCLLALTNPLSGQDYNVHIVLGTFIIIWVYDSFAYLAGSLFGKHKLSPQISPGKTWEGFFGGLVFAVAAVLAWSELSDALPLYRWIILAAALVIAGTLGDLFESYLKRRAGKKDSGNLIPGHGGILDRIDSILFGAPVVFLLIILFFTNW